MTDGSLVPDQAILLVGGRATRMRPYTDDAPKAMVPVADVPIITYQLTWLAEQGVKNIVLSCGYKAEVIQDYVGDGAAFGLNVSYVVEDEPLGRGGALKFAAKSLPSRGARFLGLNGDNIVQFTMSEFAEQHHRLGGAVTLALAPYRSSKGLVDLDGDIIRGFQEAPLLPYWLNAGVYLFEPEVVELLPDRGDHERSTFPELAQTGRLMGFRFDGYWRGVDTVKDVQSASTEVRELGLEQPARFRIA